jgi:Ca2+-transporting ATPase
VKQQLSLTKVAPQPQGNEPWHLLTSDTILAKLETSVNAGLSNDAVQAGLQKYGPNLLPESAPRSRLAILLEQFKSAPVALLSVAAGISVMTGGLADALVIMGVVVINAAIGYATESHSDRIIRSLKQQVCPVALVIRDRNLLEINTQDIVPGDILVLRPGTYVPADARVIEAKNLSVDEAALTGESMPVTKLSEPLVDPEIPLGDRINMVYMGTLVTGGQGLAVVVATGSFTEMGRIQTLVGEATIPETPMERQLDQAGSQLALMSSAVCGVVFALGMLRGYGVLQMLKTSVSLAVAAVPEGLPAVATTTLALGIREMRRHKVLIRRLDAVETLGSVQALCLDKTGTLTINKMSVVELYVDGKQIHITEHEWSNGQERVDPHASEPLLKLLHVLVLCNESAVDENSSDDCALKGSSTENALLELAIAAGIDVPTLRQAYPLLTTHHRSQDCNVMVTLHTAPEVVIAQDALTQFKPTKAAAKKTTAKKTTAKKTTAKKTTAKKTTAKKTTAKKTTAKKTTASKQTTAAKKIKINPGSHSIETTAASHQKQFVAVKGSPTEVLSLCNWCFKDGKIVSLTQADRKVMETENDRMAGQALRVLGIAYRYAPPQDENGLQDNLIWLGLVGMADPIRANTRELMQIFHQAGIETIMITGDQSPTAYAIGKELNLNNGRQLQILDSTSLTNLDPEVMQALCEQVQIFARISPSHKLQIVQALQRTGKVVAMTGDGINDAPALKAADVGVAMGHIGTDVAREVADVVLEDDDLQTMTIAVSRGRTIYNNIRKSVHFLLSTNLSEILVMLTATAGGLGQPLNAMQLLWLNLVTDIFPGLALALDPPDPQVLNQPPRDPNEPIIKSTDFKRILFESTTLSVSALGAYGYGIGHYGISPRASTIAFMSLTCAQLFHALSCRSTTRRWGNNVLPPNPHLMVALTGSLALQFLSVLVPGLRTLLHIAPIDLLDSAVISVSALLPLLVNEGTKRREGEKRKEQTD